MRNWTEEQKQAIETSPNLLVSAAAGSGKTAVLVERIIRKLLPDANGNYIPVDRLLVVTFARDAAREMQERIRKSLNEAFMNAESSRDRRIIREQLKKLVFADIATIDSFCMRFVKQNFHLLGIDPGFTLFDPSEVKVYLMECMDEYFDKLYKDKDERFFLLTSLYSRNFDDRELSELIYSVFEFTRALPDPDFWLNTHAEDYMSFTESKSCMNTEVKFTEEAQTALSELKSLLQKYKTEVGTDDETTLREFGFTDFYSVLCSDINNLSSKSYKWNDIYKIKDEFSVIKKSSSKKPEVTLQKQFIDVREAILKPVREFVSTVDATSEQLDKKYREELFPHAVAIAELTSGFADYVFDKKTKAGRFEFNDLEHMTLNLLRVNDDLRQSISENYSEILMDEYQDTNALQEEIFNLISNSNNRFMVGDMKQSIYRFRNSDPLIFRSKDEMYSSDKGDGQRVILSKNFRSRPEVLESINVLFRKIMSYNVGEVDYDDDQALHYGNTGFENRAEGNDYTSEIYVIEGTDNDEETLSDEETEAAFIAGKIRAMIDSKWQVYRDGKFENSCESDFAILMNAVKSNSGVYINALKNVGLNAYAEDDTFFEKTEILLITSFVKVINNPFRDIPLVSVMRSPVYRFTDGELAEIRLCAYGEMWNCVLEKSKSESELGKKCLRFAQSVNSWREMSKYMDAQRLIRRILTDSSLYDMCAVLYGGEAALSNLKLYMERAGAISDGGSSTLYDFEIYMDRLKEAGGIGSAVTSGEGIPIMTIHKSKGLEFPVVFVCGTGKRFLFDGYDGRVNLHKDLGFGLSEINVSTSTRKSTINRKVIGKTKNEESMSEQLRKLYVALTRAKEKLIVTGIVSAASCDGDTFEFTKQKVCEKQIANARSFIQCMAPAIKQYGGTDWRYNEIAAGSVEVKEAVNENAEGELVDNSIYKEQITKAFERFSKVTQPPSVSTKISVSQLKSGQTVSSKLIRYPSFMMKNKGGGAEFGTLVHSVMENIAIVNDMSVEYINSEIRRILGEENKIVEKMIFDFFGSELGMRIVKSASVFRESDFETEIPAIDSNGNPVEGETMLLQGVIDLYFYDEDRLVLVDYKTDKCEDITELSEKYGVQLEWYKYAMEKLLKQKVDEVYIYSFHKNSYIRLSNERNVDK